MRIPDRPPWVVLSLIFLLMVTVPLLRCNGAGCSWAKDTDARGLSRHHATCKSYQKSSTLATEKRREQAKETIRSVVKAHKLTKHLAVSSRTQVAREFRCRLSI